jgi:hypothetical protein
VAAYEEGRMKIPTSFVFVPALAGLALATASLAAAMGSSRPHIAAPGAVTVRLQSAQHWKVTGSVRFVAAGARTRTLVDVRHLPPHANPSAIIHAGSCSDLAHLSASALFLPPLREDATGTATGTGWVHGPDAAEWNKSVRLSDLLRFSDVVVVVTRSGVVACGKIP